MKLAWCIEHGPVAPFTTSFIHVAECSSARLEVLQQARRRMDGSTVDLRTLLLFALNEAPVYSALVPWILDCNLQAPTLCDHVQQRQVLQQYQLQQPSARPHDMRQCVQHMLEQCCNYACSLPNNLCPSNSTLADQEAAKHALHGQLAGDTSKQQHSTPGSTSSSSSSSCGLSAAATRLAKLHGHLLAHGLLPNMAQQLQLLVQLLTSGPLLPNNSSGSGGSSSAAKRTPGRDFKREKDSRPSSGSKQKAKEQQAPNQQPGSSISSGKSTPAAGKAVAGSNTAAPCDPHLIISPAQLLGCCACAARYAAKALECSGRLLACLPAELLAKLAASPHTQQYGPGLVALLGKVVTAAPSSSSVLTTPATTPHQQQQWPRSGQRAGSACATQSSALHGSRPPSRSGAVTSATGPWSAAGTPASRPGSRPNSGVGKLSGVGLLTHHHTAGGSAGGHHGPSPAGSTGRAAANAAVCNREKSRDLFFSLLRRCSSRLEALRQQQAAAAGLDNPQQQAAAIAVATTELQELLTELGLAAKQLLLQLAPGNQAYLAELFTACVVQAASSGEPILEPQLALMAQREPSKFQKLQQRLADNTGSSPVPGLLQPAAAAAAAAVPASVKAAPVRGAAGASSSASKSAAATAAQAGISSCTSAPSQGSVAFSAQRVVVDANGLQTPVLQAPTPAEAAQQQQHQQQAGAASEATQEGSAAVKQHSSISSQRAQRMRPTPTSQGLAATGLLYKLPPESGAASTGGHTASTSKQTSGLPRQIRPAPSGTTTNNSTGGSFRLTAASGISTPLPFLASKLDPSPGGASPLLAQQQQQPQQVATPAGGGSSVWTGGTSRAASAAAATLHTPASAPAAAQLSTRLSASGAKVASAPQRVLAAPRKGAGTPAAVPTSQHASSSTDVVLQVLAEVPAGQHVLLLVLHAADSSSFNRSLLQVMLVRAERLLSSCPDSLDAVGGLGQQAASLTALASYCSYLAFVAGTVGDAQTVPARPSSGHSSAQSIVQPGMHRAGSSSSTCSEPELLQQQPIIDVAALLKRVLARCSSSYSSGVDPGSSSSWCLALAVPFVCQFLQFAQFNVQAASSATVTSVLQQLRALQALPCMAPSNEGFGSLAACLSTCLAGCQLLQQSAIPGRLHAEVVGVTAPKQRCAADDAATELPADWLSRVVSEGSSLVDDAYWGVCCPGLQQLAGLLSTSTAAAQKQQQQQQPLHCSRSNSGSLSVDRAVCKSTSCAADAPGPLPADNKQVPAKQATELDSNSSSNNAGTAALSLAAAKGQAAAAVGTTAAAAGTHSSPSGAASVRHTTPLLLAPRVPPAIDTLPACLTAALADVGDPIKQQLQQAFIGQYSTDDNPVKMRDVLSLVNSILCANSLTLALSEGVPSILQQHLDAMQQKVAQQLAPAAQPSGSMAAPLQGQDLARAIHAICSEHSLPAISAALESAMQRAAAHANQASASACAALLPAEVPPAAAAAAAALVAASCKASCAQRLLQEVPTLVQSQLADHADELVRIVTRQWAVHERMTAAPSSSSAVADSSKASSSPAPSTVQLAAWQRVTDPADSSSSTIVGAAKTARRITAEPVNAHDNRGSSSSSPASTGAAKTARRVGVDPVGADDNKASSSSSPAAALSTSVRHMRDEAVEPADNDSSSSTSSCGHAANTARRINPMPLADANNSEAALHSTASCISSSKKEWDSSPGSDATAAAEVATGASSSMLQAKVETVATQAVTVDSILQACSQPAAGTHPSAQAGQWLKDLQHAVAASVAQQSLQAALGHYLAAAAALLRSASGRSEACGNSGADSKHSSTHCSSWAESGDTVPAALCTAEVLIAGVTVGQYSLGELEQVLLVLVNEHSPAAAATPADQPMQQVEQLSDAWTHDGIPLAQQTQLCQLLAGAVLYAFLTDSRHKLAVWAVCGEHVASGTGSSCRGLSRFVKLPAVLMKIARADGPLWLLHHLRAWLQAATLGCDLVA